MNDTDNISGGAGNDVIVVGSPQAAGGSAAPAPVPADVLNGSAGNDTIIANVGNEESLVNRIHPESLRDQIQTRLVGSAPTAPEEKATNSK